MTIWRGIHSHSTDVDSTPGVSVYQANTRMQKQGELQRRWGFLSSAIAQQSGPIRYIIAANGLGNNFLTLGLSGSATGFGGGGAGDPWPPPPDGPKARKPIVVKTDTECAPGGNSQVSNIAFPNAGLGASLSGSFGAFSVTSGCCYLVQFSVDVLFYAEGTLSANGNEFQIAFTLKDQCGGAVDVWDGAMIQDIPSGSSNYSATGYYCASMTGDLSIAYSAECAFPPNGSRFSVVGSMSFVNVNCPGGC